MKIVVEIDNLTDAQAIAIEDMLATWVYLGTIGSSRWTAFNADGDGNFRPRITVDGRKAAMTNYIKPDDKWSKCKTPGEMYWMDFDRIAWALHAKSGTT